MVNKIFQALGGLHQVYSELGQNSPKQSVLKTEGLTTLRVSSIFLVGRTYARAGRQTSIEFFLHRGTIHSFCFL
jgi:hypothetical protein